MALPKKLSGVRYLPSSAFNCYISILNPNAGQSANGTPNAATTVASGIHANISPWRSKEIDKSQTRVATSSYKIVIRAPKTYSIDSGMQVLVAGRNRLMLIDSISDPDAQGYELHLWCFETDASS